MCALSGVRAVAAVRGQGAGNADLFQQHFPSPEEMVEVRTKNALMDKKQPQGNWDVEAFEREGWQGASLQFFESQLAEPTPDEDMVRMWLMAKIGVKLAMNRAGRLG